MDIYTQPNFGTPYFVQGFKKLNINSTQLILGKGSARAITNDWVIEWTGTIPNQAAYLLLDTSDIGVNGCYPLGISAVTPVSGINIAPVYIIGDTTGKNLPALILATAATGFVPEGYDVYAQVAIAIIDNAGLLLDYQSNGQYSRRSIMLEDAVQVLTAGNATTATSVELPISSELAVTVNLMYVFTPSAATSIASLIPTGLASATTSPVQIKTNGTVVVRGNVVMPTGDDAGAAAVDYLVSAGADALDLYVAGFDIDLPLVAS